MAPSSSGLGRRPLKAEVAGSNPVGATREIGPGGVYPSRLYEARYVAPSSSGLGRRPLKAEVAGSNPVGATRNYKARATIGSGLFLCMKQTVKTQSDAPSSRRKPNRAAPEGAGPDSLSGGWLASAQQLL